MRLIDGDALIEQLMKEPKVGRLSFEAVLNVVKNMEPIEERKTGKWIISNANSRVTTYKCSECGRIVRDDTGYDVSKDYPYCHCGSDMRGEQK